jgi:Protein of unknown function (DUF2934)
MSTIATQKKGSWLGGQQAAKADRPVVITDEQIKCRAHEIYLVRGGKPGNPLLDWLQAEKELNADLSHH